MCWMEGKERAGLTHLSCLTWPLSCPRYPLPFPLSGALPSLCIINELFTVVHYKLCIEPSATVSGMSHRFKSSTGLTVKEGVGESQSMPLRFTILWVCTVQTHT